MPLALLLLMLASQDASQIERTVTLRLAEEPRPAPPSTAQHELQSATDQRAAPLTLEWLIEKKNGGLERAVIRTFATGTPSLSVPTGDGTRVLRVHRSGAAPVSILIEPTTRAQTYDVPPPQAGGEIFGRVLSSGVLRPEVMLLNANGNSSGNGNGHGNGFIDKAPIDSRGYFRFGAIAKAGAYSLTPVYKGPVTGSAIPVDVTLTRTIDVLPLNLPPTGGLSVSIDGSISAPGTGIRASKIEEGRNGTETRRTVYWSTMFDSTIASYQVEGLQRGNYLVELTGENAVVASVVAEVKANELTPVVLAQPRITIEGRITISGAPAPAGLLMTFANGQQEWTATTDNDGRVSVPSIGAAASACSYAPLDICQP